MKVRFVVVGKTKSSHWNALAEEYAGRVGRFLKCETTTVKEAPAALAADPGKALEQEAGSILNAVGSDTFVVLLDVGGEAVTSNALADKFRRWLNDGHKEICFVVGGHWGAAESVRVRADWRWSLSKLTFTHEMARTLAAEQVYRALTIVNGFPYSK